MRERLALEPIAADPEIGRWLAAREDGRRDTLRELDGVTPEMVDWYPDAPLNSIGSLLYHIALIEADYLYIDVLELATYPAEVLALFPYPAHDEDRMLTVPPPTSLAEHLQRLDFVRERVLATFRTMTLDDFHRPRSIPGYGYQITPEWTLHHLMQHEAEHRGQITAIRALYAELEAVADQGGGGGEPEQGEPAGREPGRHAGGGGGGGRWHGAGPQT
jgi:uncharacterized damage-inducible protein DinB